MIGLSALSAILPVGNSLESVLEAVLEHQHGFKLITEYDTSSFYNPAGAILAEIPFPESFPATKIRRLSRLSKIFFSAFLQALDHFGTIPYLPEERGMILATSHGSLESCIAYHHTLFRTPQLVSPMLFTEGGFNACISHLSIHGNFQGTLQSLSGDETVGLSAILTAKTLLECSSQKLFFAGGGYEWTRLGHQIYDQLSWGRLTLGEGATLLALESAENLQQRQRVPDCWIQDGFGFHFSLPQIQGLWPRLRYFLEKNQVTTAEIDLLVTAQNGTSKDEVFHYLHQHILPQSTCFYPSKNIGESFACSSSFQAFLASLLLKQKRYRNALVFSYSIRGNGTCLLLKGVS